VVLATRHSACVAKVSATNQLKALIIAAPEELRAELGRQASAESIRRSPAQPRLATIALARLRDDPETRAYAARRRAEGKSAVRVAAA
jgi:hypothetical protein